MNIFRSEKRGMEKGRDKGKKEEEEGMEGGNEGGRERESREEETICYDFPSIKEKEKLDIKKTHTSFNPPGTVFCDL